MLKSHRICLRPAAEQESLFLQHAGYARFAYNWAVGEFKASLEVEVGEWLNERTLRPRWNQVKRIIAPWAAALSQNAAKYPIIDLGQAAGAWGAWCKAVKAGKKPGRRCGFPRFKRRKHEQGFRADNGPDTVRVDGKAVILPRISRVPMVEELRFSGSIREVTVNRTAGRWFASFCVEDGEGVPPVKAGPTVGVDVGVGTLAVCSDGLSVQNPKVLKGALRRLRRVDKAIARSKNVHGRSNPSNRRERLYAKRRKVHARIVNVRSDVAPQGDDGDSQVRWPRCGGDVERVGDDEEPASVPCDSRCRDGWIPGQAGVQVRLVRAEFIKADPWFPSSKLCARCAWRNGELSLSDRIWRCGSCGAVNERDANTALNLEMWPGLSFPVSGRGDRVSPAMPAVVCEASKEAALTSLSEIRAD